MQKAFQVDDLKFDGKNLIIPSYWSSCIQDYIMNVEYERMKEADRQDFLTFKGFVNRIADSSSEGGSN